MNHPEKIEGFDSLQELAAEVENLRYDKLGEFLSSLSDALVSRAESDRKSGRTRLAVHLCYAGWRIRQAASQVADAWEICEPHMKNEKTHT